MLRLSTLTLLVLATAAALSGCYDRGLSGAGVVLAAPTNLYYQLEPSGDPAAPSGILLLWDAENDPDLEAYRVYSRSSTSDPYVLRGTTTSNTFHDNGIPSVQYYVTALSTTGDESDPSNAITVDERLALSKPATLTSVALNQAVYLSWDDSPYLTQPTAFSNYRVYSTGFDLDRGLCDSVWTLEGTTVSPSFLASALSNGVPRCFEVSAISIEGYESLWSPFTANTPRPDARNVVMYSSDTLGGAKSGFAFFSGPAIGTIGPSGSGTNDFVVTRNASGIFLTPQLAVDSMQLYGAAPITDLTSISLAPATGYTRNSYQAVPMWGYVFQMRFGAYYVYGALRVTAVGSNYVIFDWSLQTDPGNPQLVPRGKR